MPRPIVLGNGEMLVNLDGHCCVRDLYYPYVGWANHVGGHVCRVGVWTGDAGFAWLDDAWEWELRYQDKTLATDCTARHKKLGVRLHIRHAVLHDENVLLARYEIRNERDNEREARLFLAHDLRIDESDIGDTSCYYPLADAMVHYKRDRYFLFGGVVVGGPPKKLGGPPRPPVMGGVGENVSPFTPPIIGGLGGPPDSFGAKLSQYACGEKGFHGAEGAWRDAEDGVLSMNAIAQGAVDSVHGFDVLLGANGGGVVQTWVVAGETLEDVVAGQEKLLAKTFDGAFAETVNHWGGTVRGLPVGLERLPERVSELFGRSLLVIRTQSDKRGAILASNDTDIMETARAHYSYMWPRDGALVSLALDGVGWRGVTQPFFEFCARVLPKDRAALMHKYGPDGTIGATWHPWIIDGVPETPFQEDGTALVVYALWNHVKTYDDRVFAGQMYTKFVRPAADFLLSFRDGDTKLPLPSWDLWEERRGTHVWTTAAVIAALDAAADYAEFLGEESAGERFRAGAGETRDALLLHFWDNDAETFARMITVDKRDGKLVRDMTADASVAALFEFGVLAADDAKMVAAMQALGRKLWVKVGVGGVARYERDYYFRVSDDFDKVPGNPWIICTLWLADWYVETAQNKDDLRRACDLLEWACICALQTGVLSEQVHPFTLAPLSVAPLTWSHAQFVSTCLRYLDKAVGFEGEKG